MSARHAEPGVAAVHQLPGRHRGGQAGGRVHAGDVNARTVAVGRSPRGPVAQFTDGSFTTALTRAADTTVVLVRPDEAPHELTPDAMAELLAAHNR